MADKTYRTSKLQKTILECLVSGLKNGHLSVKSTVLNAAASHVLGEDVHANNFRASCEKLEERRLIMRKKTDLDWFINITPRGIEFLEESAG